LKAAQAAQTARILRGPQGEAFASGEWRINLVTRSNFLGPRAFDPM